MITIIQRGSASKRRFIRECDKCGTVFLYNASDEEKINPPAIGYVIQCPICKDKWITRNYYKNEELAFDHRKSINYGDDE